ncbi:hypothetical protein F5B22DRAFT_513070 [Xylaria bambusicola]|uniref:uncharacterized protein n=1 Tax=Xylaria bambusicola TaxID=326684 RepID=UPI002007F81B|nr:uncharacterized protein F5B22DRAFT_513070 [Xylaria bambusicola]KAI0521988.1 hypothetical protein F5B22DRAFT_513070 [Xylaria bambusicola]
MQQQGPSGYYNTTHYGGYPPPPPPPQQYSYGPTPLRAHPQQQFSQGHGYGIPGASTLPQGLEILFFRIEKHIEIARVANQPEALLFLKLPRSDKLEVKVSRGHANGEMIATGKLHEFTTTKADMTLWGRTERWKNEYNSFTGLGHLLWELSGDAGLAIESNGRLLARYRANANQMKASKFSFGTLSLLGSSSSSSEAGQEPVARLEIFAQGLSREQLEEIIVATVIERERLKKSKKDKRDIEIISEVLGGGLEGA